MKFSAKGEYGVRAIIDIALHRGEEPVQVKEISRRQAIPERFLEQVMASLKKAGLVEGIRGAQGGYLLTRSPDDITLADVIQAIEGPLTLMDCISEESSPRCDLSNLCVIRDAWKGIQSAILEALDSITIGELCAKKRKRVEKMGVMYHI